MKLFLTGLCLQGNKGGPAIAISLIDSVQSYFKTKGTNVSFILSVPSGKHEFAQEQKWANYYDLKVVGSVTLVTLLKSIYSRQSRKYLMLWIRALRESDFLLQMSAIAYVGKPSSKGSLAEVLRSQRFFDLVLSFLFRKRLVAWTQSYGPLNTFWLRRICAVDLKRQPLVLCRGDDCVKEVVNLLPNATAKSYPDIAITLRYDKSAGHEYLREKFGKTDYGSDTICTVSFSSVLHSKSVAARGENETFDFYVKILEKLRRQYDKVILVPHTHRPLRRSPLVCDYELSRQLIHRLSEENDILTLSLVEEDLSCEMLKSIISNADLHLGARYHSVIASLSSGVPTISLSWHPKYKDIMRKYGCEEFVCDIFEDNTKAICQLFDIIYDQRLKLKTILQASQTQLLSEINNNLDDFSSILLPEFKSL